MDLQPHVESVQRQLAAAAEAGGEEARALADRLTAALDAAFRLAFQDVLAAAADEITCELAPGSVELRMRGRDPEFVVIPGPAERSEAELTDARYDSSTASRRADDADDGGMSRINLRMPDHLKASVEEAAGNDGISVNAWLVRAASLALDRARPDRGRRGEAFRGAGRYTGWVR